MANGSTHNTSSSLSFSFFFFNKHHLLVAECFKVAKFVTKSI